jgi:hypothetical protein
MSAHQYLVGILAEQSMNKNDIFDQDITALRDLRDLIEGELRSYYGNSPRFYYGGSYGKDTMIRAQYDLDIVMYFPQWERSTLQEIYNGAYYILSNAGYRVEAKTVSLRLHGRGSFHVDVVPGRARDDQYYYATLYKNGASSIIKSSIKLHIDSVRQSGSREMIKLAKLWRIRWGIPVETFPLEQIVMRAMKGLPGFVRSGRLGRTRKLQGDYGDYFLYLLQYFTKHIKRLRVVDPANRSNVIDIPSSVRVQIFQTAAANLDAQTWGDIIW